MKSIKYLSRRLKKTKKNRNKSKKLRKSNRRRRGGMNTERISDISMESDFDGINTYKRQDDSIAAPRLKPDELDAGINYAHKPKSLFSHQPGVGRSGLNFRNKFSNFTKRLTGVDTSNCDKESFDRLTTASEKIKLRKKCCRSKSSSPFCKYAKSITGEIDGFDYNVSEMDNIYGDYNP